MFTPAKINLFLRVVSRRPDGFHDLENVFVPLWSLGDDVELLPASGDGLELQVVGADDLPAGENNLCLRAAKAFAAATRLQPQVDIRLTKRIPLSAGLGGGSSDAAAVLKLLNQHCHYPLSPLEMQGLAAELGSDVPFFLEPQPALGLGKGDILTPLPMPTNFALILVTPLFPVPVAWAFQQWTPTPEQKPSLDAFLTALHSADIQALASSLRNDLEAPLFAKFPLLGMIRRVLLEAGALAVHVSGSGPSLFALSPPEKAQVIAENYNLAFSQFLPEAKIFQMSQCTTI